MVPRLGTQVPQRHGCIARALGRAVLRAFGWRIVGELPDVSRFVVIGAPHTSNVDAVFGLAGLLALDLRATVMVKDSAFWWPLGVLLRWLGAVPIDRRSPKGLVDQTIDTFRTRDQMVLLMTPEGTRKAAREWKKGFHRIARGAGVPIVPAAANFARREFILGPVFEPTASYDDDLQALLAFFREHGHPYRSDRLSWPLRR